MKRAIPEECFKALSGGGHRYIGVIIGDRFELQCRYVRDTKSEAIDDAKRQFDHLVAAMDIGEGE